MIPRRVGQAIGLTISQPRLFLRSFSTLEGNPHIYIFPHPERINAHLLTLLPTNPPTPSLSLGTTTGLPPTPSSFLENQSLRPILQSVIAENASSDPSVQAQAAAYASTSGANLGAGGIFFSPGGAQKRPRRGDTQAPGGGASEAVGGGANAQGGAGGGGRGGYIHISDERHPPDFGRIASPEDIFGSVEVDGQGRIVPGTFQESGTYRMCTRDGVFGLSEYLRVKLVERLKVEEAAIQNS